MKTLLAILGMLCLVSCGNRPKESAASARPHKEFTLPVIPSTLQNPEERANYLLMHYWDNLDFADTLHTRNLDFMEQTFVNFLSILPAASPDSLPKGISLLMQRARTDTACYVQLADWAEKYLYDPNSPMLDETLYLSFVEIFSKDPVFGETEHFRYTRQHINCLKNRPGTLAADFRYEKPDSVRNTLHKTKAPQLLLFFYDPDCENCHAMMDELDRHPQVKQLIEAQQLHILAVYSDGNRTAWKRGMAHVPAGWTNAYECEGSILNEEVFHLRAMPTLYLLDAHKRVVLKDATLEALLSHLQAD